MRSHQSAPRVASSPTGSEGRLDRRVRPVVVHAPLVAALTVAAYLTDDTSQVATNAWELLLTAAGLPLSYVASYVAFGVRAPEWAQDNAIAASAWVVVAFVARRTRGGVRARPLAEAVAMVAAGVSVWAVFLSPAGYAEYSGPQVVAATATTVVVTAVLSAVRRPEVVTLSVVGGLLLAVAVDAALASRCGSWQWCSAP